MAHPWTRMLVFACLAAACLATLPSARAQAACDPVLGDYCVSAGGTSPAGDGCAAVAQTYLQFHYLACGSEDSMCLYTFNTPEDPDGYFWYGCASTGPDCPVAVTPFKGWATQTPLCNPACPVFTNYCVAAGGTSPAGGDCAAVALTGQQYHYVACSSGPTVCPYTFNTLDDPDGYSWYGCAATFDGGCTLRIGAWKEGPSVAPAC